MKAFLSNKLQQTEEQMVTLNKDIDVLKDLLKTEKNLSKKAQMSLAVKEKELSEQR